MKLLINLLKRLLKKHKYPVSVLIHKKNNTSVYEVQKNYYDLDLSPVTLVMEYGGSRLLTIDNIDILDYQEYTGNLGGEIIEIN